jgi:hypothetical protein
MGNKRDKHATAADIEQAIQARRQRALVNVELLACVLDVAHQQQGKQVNKRFITALQARLLARFENAEPNGRWVVSHCSMSSSNYSLIIWFSGPGAGRMGRPDHSDGFRVKIGQFGNFGVPQTTVDVDYIKRENPWHCVEHEKAALCSQALLYEKPREWANKIKALDEAKKALLAEAEEYRLSYLLDV